MRIWPRCTLAGVHSYSQYKHIISATFAQGFDRFLGVKLVNLRFTCSGNLMHIAAALHQ